MSILVLALGMFAVFFLIKTTAEKEQQPLRWESVEEEEQDTAVGDPFKFLQSSDHRITVCDNRRNNLQ